mmetsp:Transcript_8322/g.21163  ORF Transcript_8322/g.21163 Transcript_8322/m.21163 type:complete len:319 (-) Transcript_8322:691-1647(-)
MMGRAVGRAQSGHTLTSARQGARLVQLEDMGAAPKHQRITASHANQARFLRVAQVPARHAARGCGQPENRATAIRAGKASATTTTQFSRRHASVALTGRLQRLAKSNAQHALMGIGAVMGVRCASSALLAIMMLVGSSGSNARSAPTARTPTRSGTSNASSASWERGQERDSLRASPAQQAGTAVVNRPGARTASRAKKARSRLPVSTACARTAGKERGLGPPPPRARLVCRATLGVALSGPWTTAECVNPAHSLQIMGKCRAHRAKMSWSRWQVRWTAPGARPAITMSMVDRRRTERGSIARVVRSANREPLLCKVP